MRTTLESMSALRQLLAPVLLAVVYLSAALVPCAPAPGGVAALRAGGEALRRQGVTAPHAEHHAQPAKTGLPQAHVHGAEPAGHRPAPPAVELTRPCACGCAARATSATAPLGPALPGFAEPLSLPSADDPAAAPPLRLRAPALPLPDPVPIPA
jgi:hypothetical protein